MVLLVCARQCGGHQRAVIATAHCTLSTVAWLAPAALIVALSVGRQITGHWEVEPETRGLRPTEGSNLQPDLPICRTREQKSFEPRIPRSQKRNRSASLQTHTCASSVPLPEREAMGEHCPLRVCYEQQPVLLDHDGVITVSS